MKNSNNPQQDISVTSAFELILAQAKDFGQQTVPFATCLGRVLMEDIVADRDFPPFNRVTMDGIALNFEAIEQNITQFPIQAIQAAGMAQQSLHNLQHCLEVMTGAVLPAHCDAVIPYEQIDIRENIAILKTENVKKGQNIHQKGTDKKQNDILLYKNKIIGTAEMATLATVGKSSIKVAKLPKVAIISTGDELVDIQTQPDAHQIRKSNVYSIAAALSVWKIKPKLFHFADDKDFITTSLSKIIKKYQIVILSGAVSAGKFDHIPTALESLGVKKLFHKIAQRPGKPLWFGKYQNKSIIFALPGNPVSSFLGTYRYILPFLSKCFHQNPFTDTFAKLSQDIHFAPNLTYFAQVKLEQNEQGEVFAQPLLGNGSGDLANLNDADAFIELPSDKSVFLKGESFRVWKYRD